MNALLRAERYEELAREADSARMTAVINGWFDMADCCDRTAVNYWKLAAAERRVWEASQARDACARGVYVNR